MDLKKLEREHRSRLTEQQVTLAGPGTILADFQILLDWIEAERPRTKGKLGNLPASALSDINSRLSRPIDFALKRQLLKDYPNIAGLYVLLRVGGFLSMAGQSLRIDPERLRYWSALNPTERYFGLLEAWLIHAHDDVLGSGHRGYAGGQFSENLRFLTRLSTSSWTTFHEYCHNLRMDAVSTWNTQLQVAFGLIEVKERPLAGRQTETRGWLIEKARRTPWGEAVAWAVLKFLRVSDPLWLELSEDVRYGFLQPAFRRYFPEWQKTMPSTEPGRRAGVYIFKVGLDPRHWRYTDSWRRLAVPHNNSLNKLAMAVLDAFDFEDADHLYEFRFRDDIGKTRIFHHSYTDETPTTDEAIGDIGLPDNGILRFWYDFGDDWHFLLRLERIEPHAGRSRSIQTTESFGEPPEQYPGSDDWEDDFEDGEILDGKDSGGPAEENDPDDGDHHVAPIRLKMSRKIPIIRDMIRPLLWNKY